MDVTREGESGQVRLSAFCFPAGKFLTQKVANNEQEESTEKDQFAPEDVAQSRGDDLKAGVGDLEQQCDMLAMAASRQL